MCSFVGLCLKIICIVEFCYFIADSEDDQHLDWSVGLVILCFGRLPVDSNAVQKL